ncbi:calsenilin-like isoform X4 [Bombus affinis]|uniref:Calsenilin isoform X4 n=2 Tax=Bombus TaxID=28641 RepID=A0A9C6SQH1_BOMTE|nr:calsenilin isoform X4 [Bombus terrestris]XP_050585324.1 calsenilin-like isoform X4 [Bombus affinis]
MIISLIVNCPTFAVLLCQEIFNDHIRITIMSNSLNIDNKSIEQIRDRISLSLKMQRSFKKMKRSIRKITETSTSVQPHCVFVENMQDDEKQPLYIFPERLSYLTYQTGFSKDEIRKLYRVFKQHCPKGAVTTNDLKPAFYDLNGDGYITRKEMLVIMSAIYEMLHNGQIIQRMANRHVDKVFEKMDVDKDGVISQEEFMSICKNDSVIQKQLAIFNQFW